jgi:DNA-binding response OmpR family regulator
MKRILVLDDDLDILELVQMALSMNGYTVKTISRWENLEDTVQDYRPELVLLDVSLGTADGRDLCLKLKTSPATRDIAVVLFSANTEMQNSVGTCMADSFLAKPFDLQRLTKTVREALDY